MIRPSARATHSCPGYVPVSYTHLCSQIKPHFLYNVLNTISLLIKCGEYKTAIRSVEDLSYYLGGIMNVDQDITIRRELNICQAYLDLIQLRYQDRLTYSIRVDEALLDRKIPSLTLQPLIENAVKYACEPRRQATRIDVASQWEANALRSVSYTHLDVYKRQVFSFLTL